MATSQHKIESFFFVWLLLLPTLCAKLGLGWWYQDVLTVMEGAPAHVCLCLCVPRAHPCVVAFLVQ